MSLDVIILAAGFGKRMHSDTPKVLHQLAGISLIESVLQTAQTLHPDHIYVVVGHQSEKIKCHCQHYPVTFIDQGSPLGTGHAVSTVLPYLKNPAAKVLILYGDVPLIRAETLSQLLEKTGEEQFGLVTFTLDNPKGFGRIVRAHQSISKIVEEKDASPAEKKISELNSGIMLGFAKQFHRWLPKLSSENAQKEYYLTDVIAMAVEEKVEIVDVHVQEPMEVMGVNDRQQLAKLERFYQHQQSIALMSAGVTLRDPARIDIRGKVAVEKDVIIDINVILEGDVSIDQGSIIGPQSILKNVRIGKNVEIKPHCVIEDAVIEDNCIVGPFARIRPGTVLKNNVRVGNFVEVKKSIVGRDSKIPHLSYVGDAVMGEKVNFGAGAITCNYDGINKHQTTIGNNVFIGSDTQLVAPVTIEDGAFVGAGSTITKTAPADKLTLSRVKQQTVMHWQKPKKEES